MQTTEKLLKCTAVVLVVMALPKLVPPRLIEYQWMRLVSKVKEMFGRENDNMDFDAPPDDQLQ